MCCIHTLLAVSAPLIVRFQGLMTAVLVQVDSLLVYQVIASRKHVLVVIYAHATHRVHVVIICVQLLSADVTPLVTRLARL